MCSSVDKQVAQSDLALQKANTAMVNTLNTDYGISFAKQQTVLGQMQSKLSYMAANPLGYTPQELKTATTSVNENTARAAQAALGKAAAFAAAHGGADVGSGVIGQVAGEIGSEAAQSKAQQLASLSQQNEEMKQQNMWKALSGLESVGSQYGSAAGQSISGSSSQSSAATGAGEGAVAADTAGFQKIGSVMSGIGGLVGAGLGTGGIGSLINPKKP